MEQYEKCICTQFSYYEMDDLHTEAMTCPPCSNTNAVVGKETGGQR